MSICKLCCMFSAQPLDPAIWSGLRRSRPLAYLYLRPANTYIQALVFAELVPHAPYSINHLPFQAQVIENAIWAHKILTEVKGALQLAKYSKKSESGEYKRLLIYKPKPLISRRPRQKCHIGTVQPGLHGLICRGFTSTLGARTASCCRLGHPCTTWTAHDTSGGHSL